MDIKEFKDILFEKAEKACFEDYELFYMNSEDLSASIFKGEIEKFNTSLSGGASFRGVKDGRTGYAYTEEISEEAAEFVICEAVKNAEIADPAESEEIFKGSKVYPEVKGIFNPALSEVTGKDIIKTAKELESKAYAYSPKIELVNSTAAKSLAETYIANSKGLELSERRNYVLAYVSAIAAEGENKKTGGELFADIDPKKLDTDKVVKTACHKALDALSAKPLPSYKGKVIFKNEAFTDILETYVQSFFGELAQKGLSLLKGKEGEKIASDIITIADEPLLEGGYGSASFDSEGVASYDKTIVENGVLKTLLYNLKSAKKAGVSSTANGYKAGYRGKISTSPTNFYIKASGISYDELIEKLENGVIITSLSGLHAGANPISGDFSLLCGGFRVENGKITAPVDQITCAGNFFTLLKDITAIADDLKFSAGGIGSPSVLAEGISVTGA